MEIFDHFSKQGQDIIFRSPRMEDAEECLEYITVLVAEGTDIMPMNPPTLEAEKKWLKSKMESMEKGGSITVLVEWCGKVSGVGEVTIRKAELQKHVADIGISLRSELRDKGVGTRLLEKMLELARDRLKVKIVCLSVFATNERAIHVYRKLGFKEIGRLKGGILRDPPTDEIYMSIDFRDL